MGILLFDMILFGVLFGITGTLLVIEIFEIVKDIRLENKKSNENRERVWNNFVNMGK